MDINSDRPKTLKFQLSTPDLDREQVRRVEGALLIHITKDFSLALPVEVNDNWVAKVEIPALSKILQNTPKGKLDAELTLNDGEYFFQVWSDKLNIMSGKLALQASPVEDTEDTEDTEDQPTKKTPTKKSPSKPSKAKTKAKTTKGSKKESLERDSVSQAKSLAKKENLQTESTASSSNKPEFPKPRMKFKIESARFESFSDWQNRGVR